MTPIVEAHGLLVSVEREKVRFISGDTECAAWHYPGTNGACVIMAGGGAVTKEPATDPFAKRFHHAGFTVLAFDYRHLRGPRCCATPDAHAFGVAPGRGRRRAGRHRSGGRTVRLLPPPPAAPPSTSSTAVP